MSGETSRHDSQSPCDEAEHDPYGLREEGGDLLRAIAAGSIVGMPLLYTMEMWWRGTTASVWHLIVLLIASLIINFIFSLFSGFRSRYSAAEAASESVTAIAMGILYSLAILWLIGELRSDQSLTDILGRVLTEAAPVSLGICFANYQVRNRSRDGDEIEEDDDGVSGERNQEQDPERLQLRQDLTDLAATVGGATLFAYNVAPTEEILAIATRTSSWQQLGIIAVSLILCYMILFASGFRKRKVYVPSPFQSPFAETVMAYAVSLIVALVLLVLVGVPEATSSISLTISMAVVLGLPAVVGASAGRLIA